MSSNSLLKVQFPLHSGPFRTLWKRIEKGWDQYFQRESILCYSSLGHLIQKVQQSPAVKSGSALTWQVQNHRTRFSLERVSRTPNSRLSAPSLGTPPQFMPTPPCPDLTCSAPESSPCFPFLLCLLHLVTFYGQIVLNTIWCLQLSNVYLQSKTCSGTTKFPHWLGVSFIFLSFFGKTNRTLALPHQGHSVQSYPTLETNTVPLELLLKSENCSWIFSLIPRTKPTGKLMGFSGGSAGKTVCLQCRRPGFDPWVGKIPWRNGNPLQYSCLGNSMDRGVWWAII